MRGLAALALVGLSACRGAPSEGGVAATPGSAPPAAAAPDPPPPVDHLAPGELVEGGEQVFGVALPRDVHVQRTAVGSVRALGVVGLHSLVKYLRTRLKDATLTEGDSYALFEHVKLPVKPGAVFRFRLSVMPPQSTLLEADDVTPPQAAVLPDDRARWKAVGLTPEGQVLDPTHLD